MADGNPFDEARAQITPIRITREQWHIARRLYDAPDKRLRASELLTLALRTMHSDVYKAALTALVQRELVELSRTRNQVILTLLAETAVCEVNLNGRIVLLPVNVKATIISAQ